MAISDPIDAFSTLPVHDAHQKYFKFECEQKVYKFIGMPNEYSNTLWVFIKILKPVEDKLKQRNHLSVVFVDVSYLQGDTKIDCLGNGSCLGKLNSSIKIFG